MTLEQLKELCRHSLKGTAPENYSVGSVNEAIRDEFKTMCKNINTFMKNRYDIYEIIMESADEYLPNKVKEVFGQFAEISTVPQGQRAIFKRPLGKQRAKQFLTQVGLSGVYESFRLDHETFTVNTLAIGGAVSIDFERMLDNADILADCMEVILDGLTDAVYGQIQRALINAATMLKSKNSVTVTSYNADALAGLMRIVGAYSNGGVVIFAPDEFIANMGADAIVTAAKAGTQGIYHPDDIDAIHNTGFVRIFRGAPLVRLPQSYVDENNDKTVINPQYAYVFPAGKEKVVKLVFEGDTQMWDYTNKDRSMEINVYRKFGVGIASTNNWGIYKNTGIVYTDGTQFVEEYTDALTDNIDNYNP